MLSIIDKIKKNKYIYHYVRLIYDSLRFLEGDLILSKIKKKNNSSKIKIVIYSQMSNMWNNVDELYRNLLENVKFEVYILMIPEFDYSKKEFDEKNMIFDIYNFHEQCNHINTIKAFNGKEWFDLKSMNPEYVLFERPYSSYLPLQYRIKNVATYAKTCYLPYGYQVMNYLFDTTLNVDFFRYLYLYFADSYVTEKYNKERTRISHFFKIRKTELTGHPIFNSFLKFKNKTNIYWNNNDTSFKIIWAPRWTIDAQLGGSNFLNYKDEIVNYVLNNENTSLVFRPHPLTFQNFIAKGLISRQDVERYMDLFGRYDQLYYDNQSEYFSTFWHSDVFICDITSIIPCYLLTGKPIIYCHTNSIDDNDIMEKISRVSYHAYSFNDVERILNDLKNGLDPLKEDRIMMKNKLFNEEMTTNVVKNIISAINKDCV